MNKLTKINKKEIIITIILFAVIFAMRIPNINNPSPEIGDSWRQVDTESIARNFVEHRFNIFYPQFNYEGPLPNYIQLEFQITTFIIAILYKMFGYHIFLARLVPVILFMISVYYLFKLIKEIYNIKIAWLGIFIYSVLPLTLFYSRAIMPESAVLLFFNGAFYYFYMWYKYDKKSNLFLSAIFTALAISQKTPAVFIGIAMILICIDKYGIRFLKKWELWLFGIISLVPPIIYTKWSGDVAEFKFVSDIGAIRILPTFASSFLTMESLNFYKTALPRSFTLLVLVLSVMGLLTLRDKKDRPIIYFAISIVLETVFIVSVIKFRYYLIFLAPLFSILSAKALYTLFSKIKFGYVFMALIILIISFNSYQLEKEDFKVVDEIVEFGKVVDTETNPEDLIVVGTLDPARLSVSNRQGWRATTHYYNFTPKDIEERMNYFIENGAKYFVVKNHYIQEDDKGIHIRYLEDNFDYIKYSNGYKFYKLQESKDK